MTDRIVVLLDMDCFYVQVEERDNPHIRGKPAAVVQYNTWKGGGLIATNYEARAAGVKKGNMRGADARASCPDIQLIQVPVNRGKADLTKYRLAGKEVINVLVEFSDCVERASIDEAYIDFTDAVETRITSLAGKPLTADIYKGSWVVGYDQEEGEEARKNGLQEWLDNIYNSDSECEAEVKSSNIKLRLAVAALICEEMRAEVLARTGFKCSAGVSHNKMLGKLACGLHKPNQQTVLPMENVPQLWEKLPVHKIRNLGGKLGESLVDELGCKSMGDLSHFSLDQLRGRFDDKTAFWLHGLGRGICPDRVTARMLPKSIGCGKNFQGKETLNTKEKVQQWMRSLCDELSERLEEDKDANKRRAKTIHVSIRIDNDKGGFSKMCPLPSYIPERICSLALSHIQHTNTSNDNRWIPSIKNISLSAGKFEDSTGSGSANIQDMFKKQASLASTQRCNRIQSSQFGEDFNSTLNSSISTTLEENKSFNNKVGPLQSMLEKQLFLQESFINISEEMKDFGNDSSKIELLSDNSNEIKAALENPTKEEKPKTSKSFFKQFMMRKHLEQNPSTTKEIGSITKEDCGPIANYTDTSENSTEKNNEDLCDEVSDVESEDELDLLVSVLEGESSSDKSDSDEAYDAQTDIDSSFNSNRTNSQHNGRVNNSQPRCHSQDLFSDEDLPSNVHRPSDNSIVDPDTSPYLEKEKDSVNKNVVRNSQHGCSSQDLFSDDESSNDVRVRDVNNSVEPESTSYSREDNDMKIDSYDRNIANPKSYSGNENQILRQEIECNVQLDENVENSITRKSINKDNDEKMKISVSELFPDLDSIDELILPMLPVELRTEVEKALQQHRANVTSETLIKNTGILKNVSKSPTKQHLNPSTSVYEGNTRYEPESSKSATTTVLNHQGYNNTSENTENMNQSVNSNLIQSCEKKCEEDMVICDECGEQVWMFDVPEHQDFHLAVKVQKDFRKEPLTSIISTKANSSPVNKTGSGSKGKKRSIQSKETIKHQKLDLFFKPK